MCRVSLLRQSPSANLQERPYPSPPWALRVLLRLWSLLIYGAVGDLRRLLGRHGVVGRQPQRLQLVHDISGLRIEGHLSSSLSSHPALAPGPLLRLPANRSDAKRYPGCRLPMRGKERENGSGPTVRVVEASVNLAVFSGVPGETVPVAGRPAS